MYNRLIFLCLTNVIVKQNCTVDLPGGPLEIEWREEDNHVYMTGPAEMVFDGSVPLRYLLEWRLIYSLTWNLA